MVFMRINGLMEFVFVKLILCVYKINFMNVDFIKLLIFVKVINS